MEKGAVMLKKINYVLNRKQKIQLVLLLAVIFVGAFVELLGVSAILPLMEAVTNPASLYDKWYYALAQRLFGVDEFSQMLMILAAALIIIYIVKNVYITLMYYFQYKFVFNNQRKLSFKMMKSYMEQDYLFHVSKNVAELQRNITNDVNGFFTVVLDFLQFLAEISVFVVLTLFLMMQDLFITLVMAGLLGIFMLIFTKFFKKVLVEKGQENRDTNVQITKWLLQSFSGIKEIKVTGSEDFFLNHYDSNYKRMAALQRQQSILTYIPKPVMETVCVGGLLFTLVVKMYIGADDISDFVVMLSVFAVAAFRLLPSFNRMTGYLGGLMYNKPSIDAIYEDLTEIEGLVIKKRQNEENELVFENKIRLEGICFKYPNTDKWILDNVNLEIDKNSSVAFIGASGAGKTTAADIILGLLKPQKGRILVDGFDIEKNMDKWHKCIGYIPQTIYLMDDTIKANILFGIPDEDADEKLLERSIREAQLEDFIVSLKNGVNTTIGDRGVKLSGGQRQRIGIARALYRNPQVLVLDEATSALDDETEKEVMQAIDNLHGTRTLIIIAHRLSTIKKCDQIYEIANGRLILKDRDEVVVCS